MTGIIAVRGDLLLDLLRGDLLRVRGRRTSPENIGSAGLGLRPRDRDLEEPVIITGVVPIGMVPIGIVPIGIGPIGGGKTAVGVG